MLHPWVLYSCICQTNRRKNTGCMFLGITNSNNHKQLFILPSPLCSRHRNERVAGAYYILFTRFAWLQYNNDVNDITQNIKERRILEYSDKYSYSIYLVHQLFILSPLTLLSITDYRSVNIVLTLCAIIISSFILNAISEASVKLIRRQIIQYVFNFNKFILEVCRTNIIIVGIICGVYCSCAYPRPF